MHDAPPVPGLIPDWPAAATVRAVASTRAGGVSQGGCASLNLGDHVGDDPQAVAENRRRWVQAAGLPQPPAWLRQVHGTAVQRLSATTPAGVVADACWTSEPGVVCAVLTADCLPVLLADENGRCVAAAHAGWRGLAAGVLEATVQALPVAPAQLIAWLGPAIGPAAFQVGDAVHAAFLAQHPDAARAFAADGDRWKADLFLLARQALARSGVQRIFGGGVCTHGDAVRFFSHRRDASSGRQATAVWIAPALPVAP